MMTDTETEYVLHRGESGVEEKESIVGSRSILTSVL